MVNGNVRFVVGMAIALCGCSASPPAAPVGTEHDSAPAASTSIQSSHATSSAPPPSPFPTPEAACQKLMDWAAKEQTPQAAPAPDAKNNMKDCLEQVETERREKPRVYECTSKCLEKTTSLATFLMCTEKCVP